MTAVTVDEALSRIGTGPFHRRLLAIFGLVWAADAMQVLAIGFAAVKLQQPGAQAPDAAPAHWKLTAMMDQHAFMQIGADDDIQVGDMIAFDTVHWPSTSSAGTRP